MNAIPKRLAGGVLLLSVLLLCAQVQATSLTLNPAGGALSGLPGSTVGWGFTLTNDANYLVVSSAEFTALTSVGTFYDWIGPQFIMLGPSGTVSQTFDGTNRTGLGGFTIAPGAIGGQVATGSITLTYDLFSVSPNDPAFNPGHDQISVGNILTADASVSVPEPGSLLLMASAMPALVALRRRVQRWDRAAANG